MNRLLEIGFEPAGHWLLDNGRLAFELSRHSAQRNILYAFVCDAQVKYVGKTVRTLSARMAGYKNPGRTQTTNINNHERIKTLLLDGAAIEILALPDTGLLHYGQFHLNLAAALEDDIIRSIDPEWNGGKPERDPGSVTENVEVEPVARSSFTFTLHPTYARTGFFNVGLASSGGLGADGEKIEIFCGASEQPILWRYQSARKPQWDASDNGRSRPTRLV